MGTEALTPDDFTAFFQALWGFDPFPWQTDLLHRLATGNDPRRTYEGKPGLWPQVLDLPTGSGKTAALDIAVFHLALEATKGSGRRAPLRIAFVVDRRLIVDDAFGRAEQLRNALHWSLLSDQKAHAVAARKPDLEVILRRVRAAPVVKAVAGQLQSLAGTGQPPLVARRLRGGAPREDDWARTPVQPTILCSTVDQVGSRLLFRGYGVGDTMKSIHAGLLGSDCLIPLDEAHLSEPFRQTLKEVERLRAPDDGPFGVALLTATPGGKAERPFGLSAIDDAHPILSRRIKAAKPARLVELAGKQGVDTDSQRADEAAAQAEAAIEVLRKRGISRPAIGVVLNRVGRARAVFERLRNNREIDIELKLLIGPARSVDRDRHAKELEPIRTRQSDTPRELPKALVVVATQTIEAGVDIDFDGLVTEAAALDALRQRFGRLNRAGRDITPEAVVLVHKEDIGTKADDPVYGDKIAKTWAVLKRLAAEADGVVDFGIETLRNSIGESETAELTAPTNNAPVLLPAYADLWSQTSPIPNADPGVALFLHGPDRSPAGIQIVWRADIAERDLIAARRSKNDQAWLTELFTLVPPRAAEAIEVPLWAARSWLLQSGTKGADFSDTVERELEGAQESELGRLAFRWAGEDSDRTKSIEPAELRPGDFIVVPAAYGGCDEWGWKPKSNEAVIDVADEALWPYRSRRVAVRVTAELIAQGLMQGRDAGEANPRVDLDAIRAELLKILSEHEGGSVWTLLEEVRMIVPDELRARLDALKRARRRWLKPVFAYGDAAEDGVDTRERLRGVVFVAPTGIEPKPVAGEGKKSKSDPAQEAEAEEDLAAIPATEGDDLGSASDSSVRLIDHCRDVRDWAEGFAVRAGMRPDEISDVALAAYLHDAGKADPRYQAYFAGGDPYGPAAEMVLAKSGQRRLPHGSWERAGLPTGWRHEALSVRLAMIHTDFVQANDPGLVLWLIGSHHGHGRPFFPHADSKDAECRPNLLKAYGSDGELKPGPGPQSLAFDFDGRDWVQMFEALKAKYGIWGLARLETFVRLADHRASERGASPETVEPYKEAAE
jgi:CRISPR-associated endonuclease/helicase Cas3